MEYINQITNPNKLIEKKVNFFADYYNFVVFRIERSDFLDIENHISLIEKIIFQIETNLDNSTKYIDSYLTHPLVQRENKYFKEYKNYSLVSNLFEEYKKVNKKLKWIKDNPKFITSLKRFKTELKKVMFKNALKSIISYLTCVHDISKHQKELIHHTNILVSEFLLNNRAKDDIAKTFSKIITRDIKVFPFSEAFLKENKDNLEKAKIEYLINRTFKQQFEGIYHFFKEKPINEYFIYRVFNINSEKSFRFNYNKVTFYHPNHKKFDEIHSLVKKNSFTEDFFDNKDMLLALVKVNYNSNRIAEQQAVDIISKELKYLNLRLKADSYLEKYSYLSTSNFKNLGYRWSYKEKKRDISNWHIKSLEYNPYILLKNTNKESRIHLLDCESLYIHAETSKNPEDYWRYLETLIPLKEGNKQVIDVFSSLLLISARNKENELNRVYIYNSINNSYGIDLNLSDKNKQLRNPKDVNFDHLKEEIKHPFLEYLFNEKIVSFDSNNYKELKSYYKRVIWETQSLRNSIIHNNQNNEKALIKIDMKLPNLIKRFRNVLFDGIKKHKELNFTELIEQLKKDANILINQN